MKFFWRDGKFNWIDDNNVLLGFEDSQQCCERYGYLYHTSLEDPTSVVPLADAELDEFNFDPFFHACGIFSSCSTKEFDYPQTFTVKLLNKEEAASLYLTIYNSHNGYYTHGFSFDNGKTTIHKGEL